MLDKEPHVNTKTTPLTVKCRTVQQANEGGKMGWNVPDTTQEFFKDTRKPLIRSSPIMCLDHCPRKFLYEYKLGIKDRRYESALTMGTIVHKVLQSLFLGQSAEEALTVCERILQQTQEKLIGDADASGFLPTGEALEPVLKKVEEDYHKARATGLVFWKFVPFDKDRYEVLRSPDGIPMVEMLLECEYPGLSRPIRTPCDLALLDKQDNTIWIVDYKTTSFDPKKRAIPTKMSAQLGIYRLCLQSHLDAWHEADDSFPQYKVAGSMHAVIKKPGIKSGTAVDKKNAKEWGCTLFDAYIRRLVDWYRDLEEKDPKNPPMVLDPNRFGKPLMTRELFGRLKQYCKACHATPNIDHFYRVGESACLQYNKICPYMTLCQSDPAMWPDIVRNRYEVSFREDEEDNEI